MTRSRRFALSFLVLLLLGGAAGAAGVWFFFFSSSAPAAADLDNAADSLATTSPGGPSGASAGASPTAGTLDGTWTVDTTVGSFSDFSSSYAGFRVAEVLDNIGDTEAVGRTPDVSGTLTLDGQTLTDTTIEVDLTTITSDQSRRDPAIQRTLETSIYPTATFTLSGPVELPSGPTEGVTYEIRAAGEMTVHGVTRAVEAELEARLVNGVVVVIGSVPFTFSDYGMTAPRAPVVLSVSDTGTIEFQLFFTR